MGVARTMFIFKAATGYGAVIDGSVTSTSVEQVKRHLAELGLIPVHVQIEKRKRVKPTTLSGRFLDLVKSRT